MGQSVVDLPFAVLAEMRTSGKWKVARRFKTEAEARLWAERLRDTAAIRATEVIEGYVK